MKERAGQERGALNGIFVKGQYSSQKASVVQAYIADQNYYQTIIERTATPQQFSDFQALLEDPALKPFTAMRDTFLAASSKGEAVSVDAGAWFAQSTQRIGNIKKHANNTAKFVKDSSQQTLSRSYSIFLGTLIFSLLLISLLLLLNQLIKQQMQSSIHHLIEAIKYTKNQSDFSTRATKISTDELGDASEAYNQLMAAMESAISEAIGVMEDVARGKFEKASTLSLIGDLHRLQQGVNTSSEKVKGTMNELARVMDALEQGDLTVRLSDAIEGDLKYKVDNAMGAMEQAILGVSEVMQAMSEGDFKQRINIPLSGNLYSLKESVNNCAEAVSSAIDEISSAMSAQKEGLLDTKINGQHRGQLSVLTTAINESSCSIHNAVQQINSVMGALTAGDFSQRINIELKGDLHTLKDNINASLLNLESLVNDLATIASSQQQGDLTQRISKAYNGQINTLVSAINDSASQLENTMVNVKHIADTVANGVKEISIGNIDLSGRTESQAASLEETVASIEQITSNLADSLENTQESVSLAANAKTIAQDGGTVVNQAIAAMEEINRSSTNIGNIISVIDEIAFQTNLLALNAAVEAARAGEQGRGFAVVAGEVRTLAQRSADAAKEIKGLITDSIAKVGEGTTLIDQTSEIFTGIIASTEQVTSSIESVRDSAQEQSNSIQQINTTISHMESATQQNAALVEEVSAASESINDRTQELLDNVNFFNVK